MPEHNLLLKVKCLETNSMSAKCKNLSSLVACSFDAETVKLHRKGELQPLLLEANAKNKES